MSETQGRPITYIVKVIYHPDPITDDQLCVGVIALDEHETRWKLAQNWDAIAAFGCEDVSFLREYLAELDERLSKQPPSKEDWDKWGKLGYPTSITTTVPRPVLLPMEEMFQNYANRFLRIDRKAEQEAA